MEAEACAGEDTVSLGDGNLSLGAAVRFEAVAISFHFAERAVRVQSSGPDTQQCYVPFRLTCCAKTDRHPTLGQHHLRFAGMFGFGAEMNFLWVGKSAVWKKPMVSAVHCCDVIISGTKAETRHHATVGYIVANLGFLLGIYAVVK